MPMGRSYILWNSSRDTTLHHQSLIQPWTVQMSEYMSRRTCTAACEDWLLAAALISVTKAHNLCTAATLHRSRVPRVVMQRSSSSSIKPAEARYFCRGYSFCCASSTSIHFATSAARAWSMLLYSWPASVAVLPLLCPLLLATNKSCFSSLQVLPSAVSSQCRYTGLLALQCDSQLAVNCSCCHCTNSSCTTSLSGRAIMP